MVELAIEDRVSPQTLFNEKAVKGFIEKQLLPAINAQSADRAHNMLHAVKSIHEVSLFISLVFTLEYHSICVTYRCD
jgi:hypothetical protein